MPDDDQTRLPEESNVSNLLTPGQGFGQYTVIRLLGRGGMGEVYEVEHAKLGTRYALKLINRDIVERASVGQRFEREAKVMANLRHPNIVHVDDYGETDGVSWLRMELVGGMRAENGDLSGGDGEVRMADGEFKHGAESAEHGGSSLADLLTGEPLPEALVVDLLKQVLEGLSYAHEQGVVHRDLKPSNILLDGEWRMANCGESDDSPSAIRPSSSSPTAKICDFGLVRLAGEQWLQSQVQLTVAQSAVLDPDSTRLDTKGGGSSAGTSTQAMLGTFEFMAPEQKKGQEATERSDLYAVGLMAFRMLTGHDTPGFRRPSEIVPGLDPAWDAFVLRSLEMAPPDRFASAEEMAQALPDGEPSMAGGGSRRANESKRKKGRWLGLAALLVLLAFILVVLTVPKEDLNSLFDWGGAQRTPEPVPGVTETGDNTAGSTVAKNDREKNEAITGNPSGGGQLGLKRGTPPVDPALESVAGRSADAAVSPKAEVPSSPPPLVESDGDGENQKQVVLTRLTGGLRLSGLPPGATVELAPEDESRGVVERLADLTGLVLWEELAVGDYLVSAEMPGYRRLEPETVTVRADRVTEFQAKMQKERFDLLIRSKPEGAEIWHKGSIVGVTPHSLESYDPEAGRFLGLKKNGRALWLGDIKKEVDAGDSSLTIRLEPAGAGLPVLFLRDGDPTGDMPCNEGIFSINGIPLEFQEGLIQGAPKSGSFTMSLECTSIPVPIWREACSFPLAEERLPITVPLNANDASLILDFGGVEAQTGRIQLGEQTWPFNPSEGKQLLEKLPAWRDLKLRVELKGYMAVSDRIVQLEPGKAKTIRIKPKKIVPPPRAGEDFLVSLPGTHPIRLKNVGPGTFRMGDASGENRLGSPAVRVDITRRFWIGESEISQSQFAPYAKEADSPSLQAWFRDYDATAPSSRHPIHSVTWEEAVGFCQWLTGRLIREAKIPDGWEIRLPTEAEWEYAARAGQTTDYYFGDDQDMLYRYANFYNRRSRRDFDSKYDDGYKELAPVRVEKFKNGKGLYSMLGNVAEWCLDWYAYDLRGGQDPAGPERGKFRVIRGGSWKSNPKVCRLDSRAYNEPATYRDDSTGFRVVLSPRVTRP